MMRTLVVLLTAALLAPAVAHARAGQPDRRFATAGTQTLNAKNSDAIGGAVLALSNGRVLAGGAAAQARRAAAALEVGAARQQLRRPRAVRPGLPGNSLDGVRALATFATGRIVAAGTLNVNGGATRMVAVRLLPNGEVDPSFGGGLGYVFAGRTARCWARWPWTAAATSCSSARARARCRSPSGCCPTGRWTPASAPAAPSTERRSR